MNIQIILISDHNLQLMGAYNQQYILHRLYLSVEKIADILYIKSKTNSEETGIKCNLIFAVQQYRDCTTGKDGFIKWLLYLWLPL